MKFQALIERIDDQHVALLIAGHTYQLPRHCLPVKIDEADVLDIVIFVNEKETERRLSQVRKWLLACGAYRAIELEEELAFRGVE